MAEPDSAPTYVARIADAESGFRAVVTRDGTPVYTGPPRPDRETARKDAALFVVCRPEERRVLEWAGDDAGSGPEPYRYPVWRAGQQVGWVTLEEPLRGGDNHGTFEADPRSGPLRAMLEATAAIWRTYDDAIDLLPEPGTAGREWMDRALDALLAGYKAAVRLISSLDLSVGTPPRPVHVQDATDGGYVHFRLAAREGDAEPGAAPDPAGL